jgi:hypothetical protein
MIGSLLYLCASRPDIMLSVCMCARFQANPKKCHLVAIKRILRYLVHTQNLGLCYPKGSFFNLLGYSDSDYAGCKKDQKSTTGTCQYLGRSLVSWSSKKQNCVALSTIETEYIATRACCVSAILDLVGYKSPDRPCVALDNTVSQQPTASGHVGLGPTVKWRTGQSGAPHRTVRCPQNRKAANQEILCPRPAHALFTVRCTHGQKASRAFQMELQWLLGPLGL